jgi:Flp pilus assembly protein TadG
MALRKLMRSVASDQRGNVLFISAISIIVLLALGGSGVDISRLYLAKNRLQQACDAGVLAYRRTMKGTNTTTETWKTSKAYFDANYTPGRYGTANPIFPEPTVDANVVVHGVASVVVPMTLMKFFGFNDSTLATKCDAQLQLPNTDVMFVLDTTGSMTEVNAGDSEDKITVLRKAVMSFYNSLETAKITGTQVRYGFVPYSNTVNVGMLLKRDWVANSATYQSREFDKQSVTTSPGSPGSAEITTKDTGWLPVIATTATTTPGDPENCVAPASNAKATGASSDPWIPSATAQPRTQKTYRTYGGDQYSASINSSGQCTITKTVYPSTSQTREVTIDKNPNAGQATTNTTTTNYWWYKPRTFDVSALKGGNGAGLVSGGTVQFPVNNPSSTDGTKPTNQSYSWTSSVACIEERKTLRPLEPGTAWDMDIDAIPNPSNPETQWVPFIPSIVFARGVGTYGPSATGWNLLWVNKAGDYPRLSSQSSLYNACPSPARKLQTKEAGLSASTLQSYLNSLATRGWTYHDVGFLWGLRLISKEGLFSSENTSAPNGSSIGRNIIFMTDGDTDTHYPAYDAYGLSALDRRRTSQAAVPTDSAQNAIVEDRLSKYCTIAKEQKGITVWVIAFGTSLTPLLENCASQGRAFQADNADQLSATFAEIAAKIAQLRLTK